MLPGYRGASRVATCRNVLFIQRFVATALPKRPLGQPSSFTHPHLVKPGEVTPGITLDVYRSRRRKLFDLLPEDSALIMNGATDVFMAEDVRYPFRQQTDFLYLTGFAQPDAHAIFRKQKGQSTFALYVKDRVASHEIWDGPRAGQDGALALCAPDEVYSSKDFETHKLRHPRKADLKLVQKLRDIKGPEEIALLQKAAGMSREAFAAAMRMSAVHPSEHQLYATLDAGVRMAGADRLAYIPVVAGGKNALIIHYIANNMMINKDDLVLVDAGAEFAGYVSDVTRTWPVSGKFSAAQRLIYNIVLDAQVQLINMVATGRTMLDIHGESEALLATALVKERVLPNSKNLGKLFGMVYPHSIGHSMGMDVHDVASLDNSRPLAPGMVVTIEPGIYIPEHPMIPREFHNIGIRIEDDVVVTPEGRMVLSKDIPKSIADVERACAAIIVDTYSHGEKLRTR